LGPNLPLAEKLGCSQTVFRQHPDKVEVTFSGAISPGYTPANAFRFERITRSGYDPNVNYVNAPLLAEQRNIEYS
jgi:hypothetical protein